MGYLNTPTTGQVMIKMELLLQFKGLEASVCLTTPTARTTIRPWKVDLNALWKDIWVQIKSNKKNELKLA